VGSGGGFGRSIKQAGIGTPITLTLLRFGVAVRTVQVVVGKPNTPTPVGVFAILEALP
jgi:hypothetical protein